MHTYMCDICTYMRLGTGWRSTNRCRAGIANASNKFFPMFLFHRGKPNLRSKHEITDTAMATFVPVLKLFDQATKEIGT